MRELPNKLLIEIGFIATEFAVIEAELQMDLIHLRAASASDEKWPPVPYGFGRLSRAWYSARKGHLDRELVPVLDDLNRRLGLRADARNIALHGVWTALSADDYIVQKLNDTHANLHRQTLPTTYSGVKEQSEFVRALRYDVVSFISSFHGRP